MQTSRRVRLIWLGAFLALAAAMALGARLARAQASYPAVNDEVPNPYQPGHSFGQLPDGRKWGALTGINIAPDGNIWAFERCGGGNCVGSSVAPVLEFDTSGKLLRNWGAGLFNLPHGVYVDADGNIWLVDMQAKNGKGSQAFKFTQDGKLLMTLGKAGVAGTGPGKFYQPNAVIVGRNGDIFVSQGHNIPSCENSRIMKFTKDGKFIKQFGEAGSGMSELKCPHSLAMDSQGRIFVADVSNNRVAIFDQDGNFLLAWKQFGGPTGVFIDGQDNLYTADSTSTDNYNIPGVAPGHGYNPGSHRGIRVDRIKDGKVTGFIPDPNPTKNTSAAEEVAVDHQGNVYGAEVSNMDLKKYVKK